ncbi:hypothetical protein GCM10009527_098080 [Actinomadura nitritigenes]|uniref:Uncharacterized protein n=1 Tax=Actinomadura nitritigenes TaxID=134602 RepID=A0ABS3RGS3_9ACTN|nr:hypothetical protein [Actinomadura nitritigenes]MBO2445440.1 hypothetical protein [Actinomadura nitritigenes]
MGAYSYTTVVVEPDGATRIGVSLQPDESVSVLCSTGRPRAQISVMHAGADVVIAPTDPECPTAGDVEIARRLAASFERYADEVERLHALNADTRRDTAA